jgi:hypothetical protein
MLERWVFSLISDQHCWWEGSCIVLSVVLLNVVAAYLAALSMKYCSIKVLLLCQYLWCNESWRKSLVGYFSASVQHQGKWEPFTHTYCTKYSLHVRHFRVQLHQSGYQFRIGFVFCNYSWWPFCINYHGVLCDTGLAITVCRMGVHIRVGSITRPGIDALR